MLEIRKKEKPGFNPGLPLHEFLILSFSTSLSIDPISLIPRIISLMED